MSAARAVGVPHRRGSAALFFALAPGFSRLPERRSLLRPTGLRNRIRKMERLIDAVASRNDAPKLVGERPSAYPIFPEKFDWNDQKRGKAAARASGRRMTATTYGAWPVEHFQDKRYSATCELDECFPENVEVGTIRQQIAGIKVSLRLPSAS